MKFIPLTEPVTIAKALLAGLVAKVVLDSGKGPKACVMLCNIQILSWDNTEETAGIYARGYNDALRHLRHALESACDRPSDEVTVWYIPDDNGQPFKTTGYSSEAQQWRDKGHTVLSVGGPATDRSSKDMVRHAEGGIYEHIGTAQPAGTATAGEHLEMYRGQDGRLWWRFQDDFADRFTPLDHPSNAGDE
jgi:hypothetical protein